MSSSEAKPPRDDAIERVRQRLFGPVVPADPDARPRYQLEKKLGEGAMGVVWLARDPVLDRPLAVKVMRTSSPEMHTRLLSEGRALARLSHPNVVQIYEVDNRASEVSLVMEYVPGQTLRAWASTQPWRMILQVCIAAGEGLAAAHARGLAHRDFKPDNVVVDGRGCAKVLDFGLARPIDAPNTTLDGDPSTLDTSLQTTRTGAQVGTPAYMAPEQAQGRSGAIADQFSYCVTVYEVLYGARPFAGVGLGLRAAMDGGSVIPPPAESPVPARIFGVLRRGLALDPAQRWPDMPGLLHALAHDPARARARRQRFGAFVLAAAALGNWSTGAPQGALCGRGRESLHSIWNDAARDDLRRTIEATGTPSARDSAAAVLATLDDYADTWGRAHSDACEATLRGEQSEVVLDARMRCLARRAVDLRARIDVLAETDAHSVENVLAAAQRLPAIEHCADPVTLSSPAPPPAQGERAEVEHQRARLARVRALQSAGRIPEAYRLAETVLSIAATLDHPPLIAESSFHAGDLATRQTLHARGEALLRTSHLTAERLGMRELARDAAAALASNVGYTQERAVEGRHLADIAEAKALHLGDLAELGRIQILHGNLASARGAYEEALQYDRAALELLTRALGPHHLDVARAAFNLGISLAAEGALAEAEAVQRRALAATEAMLGPQHPLVAGIYNEFGNLAGRARRWEEAAQNHGRALDIWSMNYEPDHKDVALALKNLGIDENRLGRPELGLRHLERSLAIRETRLGPTHSETLSTLQAIATIHRERGNLDEAQRAYTRVLTAREQSLGADHRALLGPLVGLALVHEQRGELEQARSLATRSEMMQTRLGETTQSDLLTPLLARLRSQRP